MKWHLVDGMKITAKKVTVCRHSLQGREYWGGGEEEKKMEQMATLGQVPDFDNTKEDFDTFLEKILAMSCSE